jgi:hypothetical protein
MDSFSIGKSILSKEYTEHCVFDEIDYIKKFYNSISFACFLFVPTGTRGITNYASYMYRSFEGTLDSIRTLLKNGRITDAFVLLRKLFDDVITEIYIDVIRKDKYDIEQNRIIKDIDEWLTGKYRLPKIKKILNVLEKSQTTEKIYPFFGWKTYIEKNRELLDDIVHSNRFNLLLLNCNSVHLDNRLKQLQNISIVLGQIIMIHLSFIFYLNPQYLMDSTYMDYIDLGETPPEGCENLIAPYAQNAFDKYIKPHPKLAAFIKKECYLHIK